MWRVSSRLDGYSRPPGSIISLFIVPESRMLVAQTSVDPAEAEEPEVFLEKLAVCGKRTVINMLIRCFALFCNPVHLLLKVPLAPSA